jgi:hypothetical protein
LTESVQLRVMHGDPAALSRQAHTDAFSFSAAGVQRAREWQSVHEFRLSRVELLAGRAGGLQAVAEEKDFKTGFRAHGWDEFERPPPEDKAFHRMALAFTVRETCFFCHSLPGIYAFNSYRTSAAASATRATSCARFRWRRCPWPTSLWRR